jgi:hypothetical protein
VNESAIEARERFAEVKPHDRDFLSTSGRGAATSAFIAAGTLAAAATLLWASRFGGVAPYLLILLGTVEVFVHSRLTRATMDPAAATQLPQPWKLPLSQLARGERVLTVPIEYANLGMSLGFKNLAGYDPGVLKRYAQLIFASQGFDPDGASQYLPFRRQSPGVFRMLGCVLVCFDPEKPPSRSPDPMAEAVLVTDHVVLKSRDEILSYVTRDDFDPSRRVVLESTPGIPIQPTAGAPGEVRIVARTTDTIEVRADVGNSAILVVSSNFSTGWRVRPVASDQKMWQVLPANYALLAVPLERGKHHFVLEYSPLAFRVGRWVSAISLVCFVIGSVLLMPRFRLLR